MEHAVVLPQVSNEGNIFRAGRMAEANGAGARPMVLFIAVFSDHVRNMSPVRLMPGAYEATLFLDYFRHFR